MLAEVRQREYRLFCRYGGNGYGHKAADSMRPRYNQSALVPACADQNKKYRCAIGSTSAGAQVSSSPSARTS
jgi:hypothetical protein